MSRNRNDTGLEAIRIEGGLLSASLLNQLRHYGLPGQTPEDYGVERGLKLSDELGRYWRIAQARWQQFSELRKRADLDRGTVTVENWLLPLFNRVLGFQIEMARPVRMGERFFPISHEAFDGVVPFVFAGAEYPLDKGNACFGEEGHMRSPAGLLQEYLNADERCLWALVSNGLTLRLLRDNPAMTRPAYVEIDLERLFEEELYVDFTVFWLLLQATRLAPREKAPESCFLEQWRNQGQSDGERVLGQLRHGVTNALRLLGTGFVSHPENQDLREKIKSGELSTDAFFQELLRLIYRFLFLLTTEDRGVLLDPSSTAGSQNLYQQGYSISVLRDRARFRRHYDSHGDGWQQLCITFAGFASGQPHLAQPALGGLFSDDQCSHLEQAQLANRYLYDALFKLCYFEAGGVLTRINYRDMDTEELGSVYESLLELIPQLGMEGQWRFAFLGDDPEEDSAAGHARKLTGSYYTPDSLVQELIKSALEPVIEQRLNDNPSRPREALLGISVCDPACGSGHFLLAAARRLAAELARINAGTDQPTEADYRHALREVVSNCIYGVDINPLAVELCRTALWLEAVEPGKPLGFLDAHIQVGNSLVGILDPKLMEKGIPDKAFKPHTGDDKDTVAYLKRRNRMDIRQKQLFAGHVTNLAACAGDLAAMPEESLEQVEQKREAWLMMIHNAACQKEKHRADLFTAAFYAKKTQGNIQNLPTNLELAAPDRGETIPVSMREYILELAERHRFFHWHLAFPDVFERGGFDVLLGNPPWEKVKLIEKEFFSSIDTEISGARNAAARSKLIKALPGRGKEGPQIYRWYVAAKRASDATSNFARVGGRYPLTGTGDINLYALFAELATQLVNQFGRAGIIVPSGIATDNTTRAFFDYLLSSKKLHYLFEFENEGFFKGAGSGHMVRFALTTIGGNAVTRESADFMFQGKKIRDLAEKEKRFSLSASDINLLNPNTKTCPIFQSMHDAELTKKLYRAAPVLIREATEQVPEQNPWGIKFQAMFHMSNDSNLFKTKLDMLDENAERDGVFWNVKGQRYVPLYEAKMIYLYNHRHGDFADAPPGERPHRLPLINERKLKQPEYYVEPFYWVEESEVFRRNSSDKSWLLGWRDVTDSRASVRTVVCSIIPRYGVSNKIPLIFPNDNISTLKIACLYGNLASLPFDYVARQKLAGITLNYFILRQLPVLKPIQYDETDLNFVVPRILELTYTSLDLKPFAMDLGYDGKPFTFDPERRHQLKCELDAYYARLYGLTRDELRYILDPADIMREDYPAETFRVLKNKEIKAFGEYRTQRLVLAAWDRLACGELE